MSVSGRQTQSIEDILTGGGKCDSSWCPCADGPRRREPGRPGPWSAKPRYEARELWLSADVAETQAPCCSRMRAASRSTGRIPSGVAHEVQWPHRPRPVELMLEFVFVREA